MRHSIAKGACDGVSGGAGAMPGTGCCRTAGWKGIRLCGTEPTGGKSASTAADFELDLGSEEQRTAG